MMLSRADRFLLLATQFSAHMSWSGHMWPDRQVEKVARKSRRAGYNSVSSTCKVRQSDQLPGADCATPDGPKVLEMHRANEDHTMSRTSGAPDASAGSPSSGPTNRNRPRSGPKGRMANVDSRIASTTISPTSPSCSTTERSPRPAATSTTSSSHGQRSSSRPSANQARTTPRLSTSSPTNSAQNSRPRADRIRPGRTSADAGDRWSRSIERLGALTTPSCRHAVRRRPCHSRIQSSDIRYFGCAVDARFQPDENL